MILGLGAVGTVFGTAFLAGSCRFPAYRKTLEQWGGGLFLGGVALLSLAFSLV
ncbi:MAG TPA: hypothetical protein VN832_13100 [Stellaceae bacterium]|nr:hypothetical protein [Stellaceae bacterium]